LLSQTRENTLSDLIFARNDYYIATKKPVYHNSSIRKKIGDILFVMNASFVTSYLQDSLLDNDSDFYVINSEHKIIASNNEEYVSMNIPQSYEKYIDRESVIDSEYIAIARGIPNTELSILCITPINVIFKDINLIERITIALTCICFALLLIVYFQFFERIYRSINHFLKHMKNVEAGDINAKIQVEDNLEFQKLSIGFNSMMSKINELNEKNLNYQKKMLLQEIENKHIQLLALQAQINPHFLYNTLECINSMGVLYDSWEIQNMATSLAFIFNYSVKGEHLVFVQDEINIIKYYINIQQIRFPNKFNIIYEIDQNILSYKMLKFILQPIIENNFKHGIENSTDFYTICIMGRSINNKLVISIHDNGMGMDEERLKEVQRDLYNNEETLSESYSIGLSNINKRLRLYYGSDYGIKIDSKKQIGTKVILTMPLVS
jgi:two-component system sensor histidine kinase YesM